MVINEKIFSFFIIDDLPKWVRPCNYKVKSMS